VNLSTKVQKGIKLGEEGRKKTAGRAVVKTVRKQKGSKEQKNERKKIFIRITQNPKKRRKQGIRSKNQ